MFQMKVSIPHGQGKLCHLHLSHVTFFMEEACSHMKSMQSFKICAIGGSYLKSHVCPHPVLGPVQNTLSMDVIQKKKKKSHMFYCCDYFAI